jgi:hypothetical protein
MQHVEISLELSIFSRRAVNRIEDYVKMDSFPSDQQSKIILMNRKPFAIRHVIPRFTPDLDEEGDEPAPVHEQLNLTAAFH